MTPPKKQKPKVAKPKEKLAFYVTPPVMKWWGSLPSQRRSEILCQLILEHGSDYIDMAAKTSSVDERLSLLERGIVGLAELEQQVGQLDRRLNKVEVLAARLSEA